MHTFILVLGLRIEPIWKLRATEISNVSHSNPQTFFWDITNHKTFDKKKSVHYYEAFDSWFEPCECLTYMDTNQIESICTPQFTF